MELQFRNAVISDLPRIVEIYNSTIAGRMVTADTDPVSVESRIKWFNDHIPSSRPLWVTISEGNIIGWVSFQLFKGRPAYRFTAEISIYLDESERGKGMGKKMLEYALSNCARLEIKTLVGFIFAHNLPSIRLFQRLGFETWGQFPGIAVLDGIERDVIIAGKRINL